MPGVAETTHNLVPVCETFIEDTETPVSAFLKLRGSGPAFLLESAEQGQRVGRWSFIGYKPRKVLRWTLAEGGDPYALAAAEIAQFRQAPIEEPIPFTGGAVGFFGYDCVRAVERLPHVNPDPVGLPDMALMLSDVIVAFDHLKHTVTILANAYVDEHEAAHERAREAIREVRARLAGPLPRAAASAHPEPEFEPNMPREAVRGDGRAHHRVRPRGRRVPGGAVAALVGAGAGRAVLDLPRAARGQPVAVHVLPGLRGLPARRRLAGAAAHGERPRGLHPPDRGHAPARRHRRRRQGDRPGPAGGREGARRARDAGRPRPQRPRAGVRVRVRSGRVVHGRRDLLARDPHRLLGGGDPARGRRRRRRAPLGAPGRHAERRPEGARDGDHRRARAGQARRVRRRGRLAVLRRRPRHLHLHPHRGGQGRDRARAGGGRHGGRRQARLRIRGVAREGARRGARDRAGGAAGGGSGR